MLHPSADFRGSAALSSQRILYCQCCSVLRCDAGSTPDWDGTRHTHDSLYLAYSVHEPEASAMYVGFNPHHYSITVSLPEGLPGATWKRIVDTSFPASQDVLLGAGAPLLDSHYEVPGKAGVIFAAEPVPAAAAVSSFQ